MNNRLIVAYNCDSLSACHHGFAQDRHDALGRVVISDAEHSGQRTGCFLKEGGDD